MNGDQAHAKIDLLIIKLYIEEGQSIERVAMALGISAAKVYRRVLRGRKGKSVFHRSLWKITFPRKVIRDEIKEYCRDRDGRPINSSDLARYLDVDQSTAARWLDNMGIQRWRKRSVKVRNSAMEQDK